MIKRIFGLFGMIVFSFAEAQSLEDEFIQNTQNEIIESRTREEVREFIFSNSLIYVCDPDVPNRPGPPEYMYKTLYHFYSPPNQIPNNFPWILKNKVVIQSTLGSAYSFVNESQKKEFTTIFQEKYKKYQEDQKNRRSNAINPFIDPSLENLVIKYVVSSKRAGIDNINIRLPNSENDKKDIEVAYPTFYQNGEYIEWQTNGNTLIQHELKKSSQILFTKIGNTTPKPLSCKFVSIGKNVTKSSNNTNENLNEKKYLKIYDQLKSEYIGKKEYKLRIITVDSESNARAILMRIRAGEKFGELANQYSTDANSAKNGGIIDEWLFLSSLSFPLPLVNEQFNSLNEDLKKMGRGQMTSIPLKFGNGYIIIVVDDIRDAALPPYGELKPMLIKYIQ